MSETQALDKLPDAPVQGGGMVPTKAEHNWLLMAVRQAHAAKLCPAGETVEQTYLKLQRARELRIPLNTALALLYVVNGRVATMGRLKLSLVRKHGGYQYRFEQVADPMTEARFTIWPRGHEEEAYTATWTIAKAKERGLTGKGAWARYADYMLRWRAVSEAVDLVAPDACDLPLVEELVDDFTLTDQGGAANIVEHATMMPQVVAVTEDAPLQLPPPNEDGWQLAPEWADKAAQRMRALGWDAATVAAHIANCTSPEDAQDLKDMIDAEEQAEATPGTATRLFDGAEDSDNG